MSKNINLNPDHYKVAGRERQGQDVVHEVEKREIKRRRSEETRISAPERSQRTSRPALNPAENRRQPGPTGISNRLSPRD